MKKIKENYQKLKLSDLKNKNGRILFHEREGYFLVYHYSDFIGYCTKRTEKSYRKWYKSLLINIIDTTKNNDL